MSISLDIIVVLGGFCSIIMDFGGINSAQESRYPSEFKNPLYYCQAKTLLLVDVCRVNFRTKCAGSAAFFRALTKECNPNITNS